MYNTSSNSIHLAVLLVKIAQNLLKKIDFFCKFTYFIVKGNAHKYTNLSQVVNCGDIGNRVRFVLFLELIQKMF